MPSACFSNPIIVIECPDMYLLARLQSGERGEGRGMGGCTWMLKVYWRKSGLSDLRIEVKTAIEEVFLDFLV